MNVVCYSFSVPADRPSLQHRMEQIGLSLESLRRHSPNVPVQFFVYGRLRPMLRELLRDHGADIVSMGNYEDALKILPPRQQECLALYPVLHKWHALAEVSADRYSQVLMIDTDTCFLDDVENLFALCTEHDVYAREEPYTRASHLEYEPSYLDEDALTGLMQAEGCEIIPPFNVGVLLMNNGSWARIAERFAPMLDYVWRFATWMCLNPADRDTTDIHFLRDNAGRLLPAEDRERALPYPSSNRWIKEQFAVWLTLGQIPGLRFQHLPRRITPQGGEFLEDGGAPGGALEDAKLVHYYSSFQQQFLSWYRASL